MSHTGKVEHTEKGEKAGYVTLITSTDGTSIINDRRNQ